MNIHVAASQDGSASITPTEWQARVDLAAVYRLVAHHGWDDVIYNHCSMRVPGEQRKFLMKRHELLWTEVTASNLVKIDLQGRIVDPGPYEINPAGFVIHSAIHAGREDAACVLHTHSPAATAVATASPSPSGRASPGGARRSTLSATSPPSAA